MLVLSHSKCLVIQIALLKVVNTVITSHGDVIDQNSILTVIFVSAESSNCRAETAAERWLQSASEDKCSLSGGRDSWQKHFNFYPAFICN